MTPERFAELMGGLMVATGFKIDATGIETWRRLLSDIPDEHLARGFHRAASECKGFPTVAHIREYAADAQHGTQSGIPDVWPKVLEAVRHFGFYRKSDAKAALPSNVWKALGGDVGWEWLCEADGNQRSAMRAQFRDSYRELREREHRDRRLPESLRPRINDTPVRGLPEPKPEPLALPAPDQPTQEQIDAARLRVFRSPEPEPVDEAAIESRRQRQIEAAKRMGAAS